MIKIKNLITSNFTNFKVLKIFGQLFRLNFILSLSNFLSELFATFAKRASFRSRCGIEITL
jgi:hypothetical protein